MSRFNCGCMLMPQLSRSFAAKSGASFWDQRTHHGCLAHQAFSGSHCLDRLHDQAETVLAEGAQILDAAAVVAVVAAAASEMALI